jgi:hypothetical protein
MANSLGRELTVTCARMIDIVFVGRGHRPGPSDLRL